MQGISNASSANPPVLQISLDGYWAGYYHRDLSTNLRFLAENGIRAEYLRSQYPTKTFPNHYSIVTVSYLWSYDHMYIIFTLCIQSIESHFSYNTHTFMSK